MKIAIYNPQFGVSGKPKSLHPYAMRFLELYRPYIFVSSWLYLPSFIKWLVREKINPLFLRIVWSVATLNRRADVLISFNGRPDLPQNCPPQEFKGLKIIHLMDYAYCASASYKQLIDNQVNYVLCYNAADKYDDFFKHYYPQYVGKVVAMPFGYNRRFTNSAPFHQRINKCIALGAVSRIDDSRLDQNLFGDFVKFFFRQQGERWTHKFRRILVEHEAKIRDIMDSRLPHYPTIKDFGYDINEAYNQYKMFTTCEGIMFFPSVKTFEGIAAGSVMVCSNHPCFSDYGFQNGINCIKHKQYDIQDFKTQVQYYIEHPDELNQISQVGFNFVCKYYNDVVMAKYLYVQIKRLLNNQAPYASPLEAVGIFGGDSHFNSCG